MNHSAEITALKARLEKLEAQVNPDPVAEPRREPVYRNLTGQRVAIIDPRFKPQEVRRAANGDYIVADGYYNPEPALSDEEAAKQRARWLKLQEIREDAGAGPGPRTQAVAEAVANQVERWRIEDERAATAKANRGETYEEYKARQRSEAAEQKS